MLGLASVSFRRARCAAALTLIAASVLVTRRAQAQQVGGLVIRWDAPDNCPQQNEVSDRVRKLLGSPITLQVPFQADGAIAQADDGRYRLKLVTRSGGLVGERTISSRSCEDLARAAAVAIALLLHGEEVPHAGKPSDPNTAGAAAAGTGSQSAPASSSAQPQPVEPRLTPNGSGGPEHSSDDDRDSENSASQRRWHVHLRAPLAAFGMGPLPRSEWGVTLAAGASYDAWRLWLEGTDWRHQVVPAKASPGYSADVALLTASLRGCRAWRHSLFEIAPCVVVSLERATASGAGQNVTPQAQHVIWLGLGVGVQASIHIFSWFSLALTADGQVEASRPRISIDGVGAVDQGAPAAFTATLGPEWIL